MAETLDDTDRRILNTLQNGFPICERPFEAAGQVLGLSEHDLMTRIVQMLDAGVLSRFGPMYRIERAGGAVTLAAMAVPEHEVEEVAATLNAMPEVAHNYQRTHALNLWFVLATESDAALQAAVSFIQGCTGHRVYLMPKEKEYFLDLRFTV